MAYRDYGGRYVSADYGYREPRDGGGYLGPEGGYGWYGYPGLEPLFGYYRRGPLYVGPFGGEYYGGGYGRGIYGSTHGPGTYGRFGGVGRESYLGRGPRGYRRTDERIREDINDRLTWHPDIDASDIDVRVETGEVTLTGVVEDRRAKRLAEDIVEAVYGVDDVHNQLKIRQGFLAGLTGEKAEREVPQAAKRERGETITTRGGTRIGAGA
jgi:hypothetical protein